MPARVRTNGPQVRLAREAKGWTRDMLANKADCKSALIRKIEESRDMVEEQRLRLVAKALGLPMRKALHATELPESRPKEFQILNSNLPRYPDPILGRAKERQKLSSAWSRGRTNAIQLVGDGGIGKTALAQQWIQTLCHNDDPFRGADAAFGWSFYSQGYSETEVSTDPFVNALARTFDVKWSGNETPWQRGEKLAESISAKRAILVLDGLEPILDWVGETYNIKDPTVSILVRRLAKSNLGLCIITCRFPITDLTDYSISDVKRIDLLPLGTKHGAELLRSLGVTGTPQDLKIASNECYGHPLTLTLLATYLRNVCHGDITRRREASLLTADREVRGQAHAILRCYEKWLAERVEGQILQLTGMFDRPMRSEVYDVLRQGPSIRGINDRILHMTNEEWQSALSKLRDWRLLAPQHTHDPEMIDVHAFIREYFVEKIMRDNPEGWNKANSRLFDHFLKAGPSQAVSPHDAELIYDAIVYGCRAGRYSEAFSDVYLPRLCHGDKYYNMKHLGMYGSEIATLSHFFSSSWRHHVEDLNEEERAHVSNLVGASLRALGRLSLAAEAISIALDLRVEQKEWEKASRNACMLSEIEHLLGHLQKAREIAQRSIVYADESKDPHMMVANRTILAYVLCDMGQSDAAADQFHAAVTRQERLKPDTPKLYGFQAYRYFTFLIDQGQCELVLNEGEEALARATGPLGALIEAGLISLCVGRAHLCAHPTDMPQSIQTKCNDLFEIAVSRLRDSRRQDYIPLGLLGRARFLTSMKEFETAESDISEATLISERNGLRLYQADCHIESARLCWARYSYIKPSSRWLTHLRKHIEQAEEIANSGGYRRRDSEITELKQFLRHQRGSHR